MDAPNISPAFSLASCFSQGALSSRRQRAIEGAVISWEGNKSRPQLGRILMKRAMQLYIGSGPPSSSSDLFRIIHMFRFRGFLSGIFHMDHEDVEKSVLEILRISSRLCWFSGWCCCYCVFFSQKTVSNDFYDGLRREEMPTQTHLEPVKQVGMTEIDTLRRELRNTSLARKLRGIMKHCET